MNISVLIPTTCSKSNIETLLKDEIVNLMKGAHCDKSRALGIMLIDSFTGETIR